MNVCAKRKNKFHLNISKVCAKWEHFFAFSCYWLLFRLFTTLSFSIFQLKSVESMILLYKDFHCKSSSRKASWSQIVLQKGVRYKIFCRKVCDLISLCIKFYLKSSWKKVCDFVYFCRKVCDLGSFCRKFYDLSVESCKSWLLDCNIN